MDKGGLQVSEYVMYIAAIKLPPGKLAAQVAHAVLGCYRYVTANMDFAMIRHWWLNKDEKGDNGVQAKVVLKLESDTDADMVLVYCQAHNIPYYVVVDAGRTVVDPGTRTAIAWGPVRKDEEGPWKAMKLY